MNSLSTKIIYLIEPDIMVPLDDIINNNRIEALIYIDRAGSRYFVLPYFIDSLVMVIA